MPKHGYVHGPARFSQNDAVSLQVTITSTSPIRNKNITSRDRENLGRESTVLTSRRLM
jgi:hypothetical protein